ncbi:MULTISPECIES: glycosyltransferase family 2 protein [Citrobacter]|uniref:glycosyltransferase family 2 protein n=1 Tax=Citrobacter TaxID=544 RepID=UPI002577740C|nr:glycosyltransferase family 2 protein [Citrobacter sp. Ce104]MDM3282116.1 glycosyltransferase family 2 protein [Citrobacter sp. Ce104]
MMNNSVAILVCTYNGEKYLKSQIDSIRAQTHNNWVIYISDDGSTDSTRKIIEDCISEIGAERCKLIEGPRKGFAWNFINGIKLIPKKYRYYAFCDQDDIWLNNKIEKSIAALSCIIEKIPAVYCSATLLVDENENYIGPSSKITKPLSFKNSLIQCVAGGNTMLFNLPAKKLIDRTPEDKIIPSHDWWIYILITACDGKFIYDPIPTLKYRQHYNNLVGENRTLSAKFKRVRILFNGEFKKSVDANLILLNDMHEILSPENKITVQRFIFLRTENFLSRIKQTIKLRLYRQSNIESLLFAVALFLKRV